MNNPLKYTDPTGYQTAPAPGAVSWLGGGGGWGESGLGFGGNVNWDCFVPNTSYYKYYGNYDYYTYNWSTESYEYHTVDGVEEVSYDRVYASFIRPNAISTVNYLNEKYITNKQDSQKKPDFLKLNDAQKILEILKGIRETLLQGKHSFDIRSFFNDFPEVVPNAAMQLKGVLKINDYTLEVRMVLGIYSNMRVGIFPIFNGDRLINSAYWEYMTFGRGNLPIFTIFQNNRKFRLINYLFK